MRIRERTDVLEYLRQIRWQNKFPYGTCFAFLPPFCTLLCDTIFGSQLEKARLSESKLKNINMSQRIPAVQYICLYPMK